MKKILLCLIFSYTFVQAFAISAITGTLNVCVGSTTLLSDATPGGSWNSHNPAIAAVGSSSGIVTGISAGTVTITYNTGTDSVYATVTVNPTPALSSTSTPPALCDSSIFNYTPMSAVFGTIFSWDRPAIIGIAGSGATGTGNPNESLADTSVNPIAVVYTFTLTANGCSSTQSVTVTVNPTPKLSGPLTMPTICDSQFVKYTATCATPGATFMWIRPGQPGIIPGGSTGTGNINELLLDTTNAPVTVTYYYRLGINGCTNAFPQAVTIVIDTCKTSAVMDIAHTMAISIFPNPTSSTVTISGLENADELKLVNTVGSVVFSQKNRVPAQLKIDLSAFPAGMYFLLASGKQGSFNAKILKQ